ncbi:RecF/RecN/SMC N terminal domain protein [Ralstonia phage RSP15]|uniref:RecF/RecN/SMC N terminal domain protein n=1 Tax=Ralstonia phage RSP15 TaxID=1785960 RepID=UPI00074D3DB5|nr:RecF/RecN/SMC N terminal domain protein [Ralstonia phage RSP15]BAU40193.1 RecF/RecN/SMC N terminal domain protein [Ralstonia phage RSP15]
MRVTFEKVWCKNFRSIDNMGMEIILNKSNTTLVTSLDNGQGKSTMVVHAIYFALFDKAYGKGNTKPSLVNSRSGKDCVVEVDFETLGSKWKVRRGIKPNIFDIEKDGVRVEDEAALKDYQAFLIKTIGFDEKAFTNTVVLGKDKFVPFISMSAAERRAYSEHMMNVTVFSAMNEIAKADLKALKSELSTVEFDIQKVVGKMDGSKRVIQTLENTIAEKSQSVGSQIAEVETNRSKADEIRGKLEQREETIRMSIPVFDASKYSKVISMVQQASSQISALEKEISQIQSLESCDKCGQSMDDDVKHALSCNQKEKLETLRGGVPKLEAIRQTLESEQAQHQEAVTKHQEVMTAIQGIKAKIQGYDSQLATLRSLGDASKEQGQLDAERKNLESLTSECDRLVQIERGLMKKQTDLMHLLVMLKDDGVKASIIKLYVPYLNERVNEYLRDMNLFVNVTFDEEFDVEMFDPTRKGQNIASLSSGQICRIDLAVLLAWRDIARSKASADTNLLVFDEILESLSENGITDFMGMFETKMSEGVNLFVITQRASEFGEYFEEQIVFALKDDHTYRVQ